MQLAALDWLILIVFFIVSFLVNLRYRKAAGRNLGEFFLGGRRLPWYLAGVSMVATTFAADTPLAVTEIVAKDGIAGNWLWWNALAGGMLTVFFFAHLWRRAGVLTEVELIELRYTGKPAAFLRGFKAVYLGLFMNVMIIGWVNLALMSLLQVFFGITAGAALWCTGGAMLFVALYASISGLKGIAVTDMIQFCIAMVGCVVLAVCVLKADAIGGISGLKTKLADTGALEFFPAIGTTEGVAGAVLSLPLGSFLAFATMQWWASWYPGAEPGGGGYVAQRAMSTRSEKDAVWATLFFQIAHYCIRPWPWIIVGLCALVLYPDLEDPKLGYVMAMKDYLPVGLKGLLLTAFFAAYMSTISTQLNWGAGYLVNDLYKRFLRPEGPERHLVPVSRITTLLLMVIALLVTSQLTSIKAVWEFIFQCGAGLGMVLILRWYWWRINAWSEIAATLAPFIAYGILNFTTVGQGWVTALGAGFPFMLVVGFTTVVWLVVTWLTPATEDATLQRFQDKVQPGGWWGAYAKPGDSPNRLGYLVLAWLGALVMTYSCLFWIGKLILAEWRALGVFTITGLLGFALLRFAFSRTTLFHLTLEKPS